MAVFKEVDALESFSINDDRASNEEFYWLNEEK